MASSEPAPIFPEQPAPKRRGVVGKTVTGFFEFVKEYGIASLAIGVVIGTSVNDFVKTLVDGLITPLISLVAPQQTLQSLQVTVGHSVFKIGAVLSGLISLLVVFLIVYLMVKLILRNEELLKKKS